MVNYLEQLVSGEAWHRFNKITIDNPYGGPVRFTCFEQEAILSDTGEYVEREFAVLSFEFNLADMFAVFDTTTATPTGSYSTGTDLRQLMYSYIMDAIIRRDGRHAQSDTIDASDTLVTDAFTMEIGITSNAQEIRDVFVCETVVDILADLAYAEDLDTLSTDAINEISALLALMEDDDTFSSPDGNTVIVIYTDPVEGDDTVEVDVTVV